MGKLEKKHAQLVQVLSRLSESVEDFQNVLSKSKNPVEFVDYDRAYQIVRDSLIQRFEFCVELTWKYLKKYLEAIDVPSEIIAPSPVVRRAYAAGILPEYEAEQFLQMIRDRNLTSHMYKEEVAEYLSNRIARFYELMQSLAEKFTPESVVK